MTKKPALLMAALVGGLLVVSTTSIFAADKVIKIGGLFPISGPGSYFGVQDKQGAELAIEQLNKSGVNGYKFEVHYEDFILQSVARQPGSQAHDRAVQT